MGMNIWGSKIPMHSNLRALCARKHCKASAPRREVPASTVKLALPGARCPQALAPSGVCARRHWRPQARSARRLACLIPDLFYRILSYIILSYLIIYPILSLLSYLTLSYIRSYLSYPILHYLIWSRLWSYFILSYLLLSYLIFSFIRSYIYILYICISMEYIDR